MAGVTLLLSGSKLAGQFCFSRIIFIFLLVSRRIMLILLAIPILLRGGELTG